MSDNMPDMSAESESGAVTISDAESENLENAEPAMEEREETADEESTETEDSSHVVPSIGLTNSGSGSQEDEMIPDGWPEYVPIMDGFRVNIGSRNNDILTIVAYGDEPIDAVREFYLNLPEWELTVEPDSAGANSEGEAGDEEIYIFSRGNEKLMFKVFENEGQTGVNLMYQNQAPEE